ncbi:MAG TPA: hypothetical protein DIC56_11170 [Rhizobium sp.]|nr:hypothetical protein [Rhizobium sp.]
MRGLAFYCYLSAAIYALLGMALGIFMAASHDHGLSAVHAHLNLLGWASFALYGLFYQAVPAAAATRLARIHVAAATLGVWLIIPGIALAVLEITEGLAVIGSFVTILAMALFAFIVARTRGWNTAAD